MDTDVTQVDESIHDLSEFLSDWIDSLSATVESVQDGDVQMPYREFAEHCSRLEIMESIGRSFATEIVESYREDSDAAPASILMRFTRRILSLKAGIALSEDSRSILDTKMRVIDIVLAKIASMGS